MDNGYLTFDIGTMVSGQWNNRTLEQWNGLQLQLLELLCVFCLDTADLFLLREDDHKYKSSWALFGWFLNAIPPEEKWETFFWRLFKDDPKNLIYRITESYLENLHCVLPGPEQLAATQKILLAPTGVLAHRSLHAWPSARPPIDTIGIFRHNCLMGEGKWVFSRLIHSVAIVLWSWSPHMYVCLSHAQEEKH
jgi:hypothetical protein